MTETIHSTDHGRGPARSGRARVTWDWLVEHGTRCSKCSYGKPRCGAGVIAVPSERARLSVEAVGGPPDCVAFSAIIDDDAGDDAVAYITGVCCVDSWRIGLPDSTRGYDVVVSTRRLS